MNRNKRKDHLEDIKRVVGTDQLLQSLMTYSPALISAKDLDGTVMLASESFRRLHPDGPEHFIGKSVFDLFPENTARELWRNDITAARHGKKIEIEETVSHSDGSLHTYFTNKFPLYNSQKELIGTCAISIDITDRKQAEKESLHDELTGLLNRRSFKERLEEERRRAKREQTWLALLMIDVDDFKKYNDYYGHLKGDRALQSVAGFMRGIFKRPADHIFRIGGEEFAVIFPSAKVNEISEIMEELRLSVEAANIEHNKSDYTDHLTISIGAYAIHPNDNSSDEEIFHQADDMLYSAKRAGKNCVRLSASCL